MTNLTFCISWKVWMVIVVHLSVVCSPVWAQIEVSFTTETNTNCNGIECAYEGPKVLINEMVINPVSGDGAIWHATDQSGGEWVELYNPDLCSPVDISCFYIGNNAFDALADPTANYPGGFVIPPGTVLPPAGFLLIHGINSPEITPELLDRKSVV